MSFTVSDLLGLHEISGIRLVAGKTGSNRVISRTNIMDNPDTFDWLTAGELVLSTGYVFKESEELQRKAIQELSKINCAGLCIKIQRYLPKIPDFMAEEADRLDFPLIELPFGHSLSTVSALVNNRVIKQENSAMDRVVDIHRELMRASLSFSGLGEVANTTASLLGNPIIIVDNRWNLLAVCELHENPHPVARHLKMEKGVSAFPEGFCRDLPITLDRFRKAITRKLPVGEGIEITCRVQPIVLEEGVADGYVVVWEVLRTLDSLDYIALEQAAVIAAMERARANEVEMAKLQSKRSFFDDLLAGNIDSQETANSMAELYGLNRERQYTCILLKYVVKNDHQAAHTVQKICQSVCQEAASKTRLHVILIPRTLQIVLLLEADKKEPVSRQTIEQFCELLTEKLNKADALQTLMLAVGRLAADITDISSSFYGAQQAIAFQRSNTDTGSVVFIEDYAVYQLLSDHVNKGTLRNFRDQSVGRLMEYDLKNGTQLIETFEKYFAFSGNISEAAKKMYIHRNTYIYRLEKIKQVLGNDLQNPQKLMEYQIGLMTMRLLNK